MVVGSNKGREFKTLAFAFLILILKLATFFIGHKSDATLSLKSLAKNGRYEKMP